MLRSHVSRANRVGVNRSGIPSNASKIGDEVVQGVDLLRDNMGRELRNLLIGNLIIRLPHRPRIGHRQDVPEHLAQPGTLGSRPAAPFPPSPRDGGPPSPRLLCRPFPAGLQRMQLCLQIRGVVRA